MDAELCFLCGDRTQMSGMKEDSIYHDGRGPFCLSCFEKLYGMDRKPLNRIYHAQGHEGNAEEGVVVAESMENASILMGYGKKWTFTVVGTAREDEPEEVITRVESKTKPIFVATGRNGNPEEAVVIADDKDEAVLLLGKSHDFWSFDTIGWADETGCASDVLIRVDGSGATGGIRDMAKPNQYGLETSIPVASIPHNAICFFKDGDKWCCVFGDFIDLQQSPAGFGDTFDEALDNLNKDRAKVESIPEVCVDHGGT